MSTTPDYFLSQIKEVKLLSALKNHVVTGSSIKQLDTMGIKPEMIPDLYVVESKYDEETTLMMLGKAREDTIEAFKEENGEFNNDISQINGLLNRNDVREDEWAQLGMYNLFLRCIYWFEDSKIMIVRAEIYRIKDWEKSLKNKITQATEAYAKQLPLVDMKMTKLDDLKRYRDIKDEYTIVAKICPKEGTAWEREIPKLMSMLEERYDVDSTATEKLGNEYYKYCIFSCETLPKGLPDTIKLAEVLKVCGSCYDYRCKSCSMYCKNCDTRGHTTFVCTLKTDKLLPSYTKHKKFGRLPLSPPNEPPSYTQSEKEWKEREGSTQSTGRIWKFRLTTNSLKAVIGKMQSL